MRHSVNPQQGRLFDLFEGIIPPLGLKQIRSGWQGVFRHVLLTLMPAHELAQHFHPVLGRPTKELYSLAGLLFLQEVHDWTNAQSVEAYLFHTDVQYALNLEPGSDEMCDRTFERYRALFLEDELARGVMDKVTAELVQGLEINIDEQRLDSTHVFSNMASFGRTRLMGVTIKRFLTQAQRHCRDDYDSLPEALRRRYAVSTAKLFAGEGKSAEDRLRTRQRVAEDLHALIERFAKHKGLKDRPSYKAMVTVFTQQCELVETKVQVREKSGGHCMQNPSDPDATYDGHKGEGFKVHLSETCSPTNDVQMIVMALPDTAANSDANALPKVLENLEEKKCLPEVMTADTSYGSDSNVQLAAEKGVELVSPVSGPEPDKASGGKPKGNVPLSASDKGTSPAVAMELLTIDDFAVDERTGRVTSCPSGRIPLETIRDAEARTTSLEMAATDCQACRFGSVCPIQRKPGGHYRLSYTDKERRLAERRREEDTEAFRERYAIRSGIESTNSGLKRRLGLGKLRVRGRKGVFHALYLKVAGWNVFRAVASGRLVAKVAAAMAAAVGGMAAAGGSLWSALGFLLLLALAWGRIRAQGVPKLGVDHYWFQNVPTSRLLTAQFCRARLPTLKYEKTRSLSAPGSRCAD